MERNVMRLNSIFAITLSASIFGCGFLSDSSYDEDAKNDRRILEEIIKANPVLDSAVNDGHSFLPTSSESMRITGDLDLRNLGLNDSNFHFPTSIRDFKLVNHVNLMSNNFTDLPQGTFIKKWEVVLVLGNKICNPPQETIDYLDDLMNGYPGGYWRDSQRCGESISKALL